MRDKKTTVKPVKPEPEIDPRKHEQLPEIRPNTIPEITEQEVPRVPVQKK